MGEGGGEGVAGLDAWIEMLLCSVSPSDPACWPQPCVLLMGLLRPSGIIQTLCSEIHQDPFLLTTFQPNIPRKSLTIHIHTWGFGLILRTEHGAQMPMHGYMTDAEGRKTDCRPGHSRKRDKKCKDGTEIPGLPGVLSPEHSGEGVDSQPCSPWSELPARASANSRQQSMESLFL